MSTARTARTGRRNTNRLWLETNGGLIPTVPTDFFVGTTYASAIELGLPYTFTLPFIGKIDVRLPLLFNRLIPGRASSGYFYAFVDNGRHSYATTPLCDTEADVKSLAKSLVAALDEHRDRAGILVHTKADGWTVEPLPSESGTPVGKRPFNLPEQPAHDGVAR